MMTRTATHSTDDLRSWESAEIGRSAVEATLTENRRLAPDDRQVQRYMTAASDTPYPLEYAYYLLGDVEGKRVLDLGCGSGENTALLARRGARVSAIDISVSLLRLARRRVELHHVQDRTSLVASSAHALPVATGSIDVVFGIAVLHHLDLMMVQREVVRVLKPGGRAIFQEPIRNSPIVRAVRRLIPYRAPDVSPYERPLTDRELAAFASAFASVRARAFMLPTLAAAQLVPPFRRRSRRLYDMDAAMLQRWPFLRYYAGIRVFEVTRGGE
jgi:SAM-dependent methyltransferase